MWSTHQICLRCSRRDNEGIPQHKVEMLFHRFIVGLKGYDKIKAKDCFITFFVLFFLLKSPVWHWCWPPHTLITINILCCRCGSSGRLYVSTRTHPQPSTPARSFFYNQELPDTKHKGVRRLDFLSPLFHHNLLSGDDDCAVLKRRRLPVTPEENTQSLREETERWFYSVTSHKVRAFF